MLLYAVTIFLSAFLLFQVQPLIGKYILPWFGGTPGVWTTCLLFFQVALLGGYAYAHLVVSRLSSRRQAWVHLVLLGIAALTLPIIPSEAWKPVGNENPVGRILGLLAATVGLPYLLLSTTGPLLQGWFSRTEPGRSPYRLYALSNTGSLLALLSYPVLFEHYLRLPVQVWGWSAGYLAFVVVCGLTAWRLQRLDPPPPPAPVEGEAGDRPRWTDVVLWLALAACASLMLLATTNQMCQDVAVVPFLWVAPLSLYLITFIICFDREAWYYRPAYAILLAVAFVLLGRALVNRAAYGLGQQIAVYLLTVFAACMVCHGELVKLKPAPRHLTLFYLMVSAGGALGGAFVALVAPRVFAGYWELHCGVAGCGLVLLLMAFRDFRRARRSGALAQRPPGSVRLGVATGLTATVGFALLLYLMVLDAQGMQKNAVATVRNFYGVLRVLDEYRDQPEQRQLILCHGQTRHGYQFRDPAKRAWPTAYFGPRSGVGRALLHHPAYGRRPLTVGVIGLGAGTLAVYAQPGDHYVFYEINPLVKELDDQWFTYLPDAERRGARVECLIGDGRIVLERELAAGRPRQFDVLIADAFSSDAIPTHLLTAECARLYWQHLKPDGTLVIQVTNRYLDITPVVRKLAELHHQTPLLFDVPGDPAEGTFNSRWVVSSSNPAFLGHPEVGPAATPWPADGPAPILWTDDFTNLFGVLLR